MLRLSLLPFQSFDGHVPGRKILAGCAYGSGLGLEQTKSRAGVLGVSLYHAWFYILDGCCHGTGKLAFFGRYIDGLRYTIIMFLTHV